MTFALAAWKFLRGIPWQVWAVIAVAVVLWRWGESRYDAGFAASSAECAEAAAQAAEAARTAAEDARRIGIETGREAAKLQADIAARAAGSVERIRYVTRTIEVPAGCPVSLPPPVVRELEEAVDRARAAGR